MDSSHLEHAKHTILERLTDIFHQQERCEEEIRASLAGRIEQLREENGKKLQLTLTEIHVLSCIGDHEPINVTSIADKMETTKATVSRICSKFLQAGFLRRTRLSDNKKEVYFRLAPAGKELHSLHQEYHENIKERFMRFLDRYTEEELLFAERLFRDLSANWRSVKADGTRFFE
ncbi:MarR family transcriptional regulator [Bacillus nakamurai]|uniref:Transcriptional regulator n=1 Tax=Bacillus nakamurai TaxID=1793963 RepID=A0A150F6K9_9BACI|nr:MarR family transcriptional regulator [Bacillus nakamurai]KXZ18828.1 transcriptional regulator [Bacillus nakamurai]MED1226049.1 MarR family transcriptional regulator [Bacillus nakamurai]